MSIQHIDSGDILSRATVHNGVVYLCGLTATDRSQGIQGQTAEVLAKIDERLAQCGSDKSKMLSATIYLSDIAQKPEMNLVWMDWLGDLARPARTCVGAPLASPEILIEITVMAAQ